MKRSVITKPVTIALMEIRLLTILERKVKSVITVADSNGKNKIHQTNDMYSILISANHQSFIEVKSSTCAVWRLR